MKFSNLTQRRTKKVAKIYKLTPPKEGFSDHKRGRKLRRNPVRFNYWCELSHQAAIYYCCIEVVFWWFFGGFLGGFLGGLLALSCCLSNYL